MPSSRSLPRSSPKIPLHWVLVIPFVLQTVGAVGIVGWLSYRSGQKVVEQIAYQLLETVSEQVSDRLDTLLQAQQQEIATNPQTAAQGNLSPQKLQSLRTRLNPYLSHLDFSPSSFVFIVEPSGNLVATSTLNNSLLPGGRYQPKRFASANGQDARIHKISQQLLDSFGSFRNFQQTTQLTLKTSQTGEQPQFVQVTPYQGKGRLDWLIITVVPESDFIGEIQTNLWRTVLLSFLTLMCTTATGVLTAFWIAKPIRQLSRASQTLASGQWQQSLQEDSWITELSVLAKSFNRTADQLQQSFDRIKVALQASEEKFTKVFRTSPDPITIMTLDEGRYLEVNESFLKFSEYSQEEVIGRTSAELNLSVDYQQDLALKEQLERQGTVQNFEYYYRTKTGQVGTTLLSIERVELDGQQRILTIAKDISDRKQTEHALRQAIQQINTYFEHSPLAIMEWDQTGRILRWSTQAERVFGWTADEIQERRWQEWEIVHEDDQDRVITELTPLMNGLTTSHMLQNRNRTKDGRVIVCEWYSSAIFDETGNLISVLSFAQDITERIQMETALQESEARNRAILQAIPDLMILYTAEGTYVDIIQRNLAQDAITDPDPVGKHISELLPSDIAERQINASKQVLATGEIVVYEQELWIQGTLQYEEVRVVPCGEETVLVIVRDISDRKRNEIERQLAEEALQHSEEQIRRAFEDAAIGMAIVGLDGRFLRVSHSLCEIVGYSETELLAMTFHEITHPDDLLTDLGYSEQMLSGELRTYQLEKRYIHKQGYIIWILVNVSLVKDNNDQPLYFVSQIQDISDRHELDRIKNEFISIVSHELRTPLTAIRGSLGILATGVLAHEPDTAKAMLHVALNNSERLVRLVNDILDLERLESGKTQLVMEECSVNNLLMQAIESVQTLVAQASISLKVTSCAAKVWASPDAIVQTLTNLIGNAVKFSEPGSTVWLKAELKNGEWEMGEEAAIEIWESQRPAVSSSTSLSSSPYSQPFILFSVADQGRGIPPEKLESIFGRFQQVDVSDSRDKCGTGLGLAICKSIVQQHGGKIWVTSVLNEGSTFYFTVPQANRKEE
ncbi:PAS domain S-box [Leptolyngbyaceae cyanobacterium JSC-12]|nr:PAS domain S-box [Leptolyngbyaceae cyanobacterium JSC-12]